MKYIAATLFLSAVLIGCADTEEKSEESPTVSLHPEFAITVTELSQQIGTLPDAVQNRILNRPQYFLELIDQVLSLPNDYFIRVDKQHGLSPDYEPSDLVDLSNYNLKCNRTDLRLRRAIMPDVLAMTEAARIDGVELVFSSAYRSYEYQETVFTRHVRELGEAQAKRESAEPGKSQHQLGTTIDFGSITPAFADTAAGKWLVKNGWKFGFSLSYPEGMEKLTGYMHEIWHYRYITRTGTALEHHFFNGIQHYLLAFLHEKSSFFMERRLSN